MVIKPVDWDHGQEEDLFDARLVWYFGEGLYAQWLAAHSRRRSRRGHEPESNVSSYDIA